MRTFHRLLLIVAAMLVSSAQAYAQTVVDAKVSHALEWTQDAPTLEEARAYRYAAVIDGARGAELAGVACSGAASPFTCTGQAPAFPLGAHAFALIAVQQLADGAIAESLPSTPLALLIYAVPLAPGNLRLVVTVSPPAPSAPTGAYPTAVR